MSKIMFDAEAASWNEALPLGNGTLGAMVFGGVQRERVQLNEDSVWSGGPMDRANPSAREHLDEVRDLLASGRVEEGESLAEQTMLATPSMRHYQTLGDLWIDFPQMSGAKRYVRNGELGFFQREALPVEDYARELDLATGVGSASYVRGGRRHSREFFSSYPDQVIAYHMEGQLNFAVSVSRKDNRRGRASSYCDAVTACGNQIVMTGSTGGEGGIGFCLVARVLADGEVRGVGSQVRVVGATQATILVTARTTFRSDDPLAWCAATLKAAEARPYEELRSRAVADYRTLFDACRLSLGQGDGDARPTTAALLERARQGEVDPTLAVTYFDFARYLLISSSRPGSLPATLQGIWNENLDPLWGSRYTLNINTEMNYWLAETVGLQDLHMPLFDLLERMDASGQKVARDMYGCRGFCCHHNTNIWADCAPQDEHLTASVWPMGGAWLATHAVEHYRYGRDLGFARRMYPVVRDAALFFVDYLVRDADGWWVTGPSASPENTYELDGAYANLCMGPTLDTEILRDLFEGYLELAADLSGKGEPAEDDSWLVADVRERLGGLRPLRVGKHGQICEWGEDYDEPEPGHRHISQLYALYPSQQIRADGDPELFAAAGATIDRRLANGGGHTGWSKAWIILFCARLGRGEDAWRNFRELLGNATLPNLFDNHPPFQIDGNFGAAAGLLELFVRDYGDSVWLLPATPAGLSQGSLEGVRLKAGGVLGMRWRESRLAEVHVRGVRAGRVRLVLPDGTSDEVAFKKNEVWTRQFKEE